MGAILGETPADQKARIAEATKNANDLSGLVKKKKPAAASTAGAVAASNAVGEKRKAEDGEAGGDKGKKARTE